MYVMRETAKILFVIILCLYLILSFYSVSLNISIWAEHTRLAFSLISFWLIIIWILFQLIDSRSKG